MVLFLMEIITKKTQHQIINQNKIKFAERKLTLMIKTTERTTKNLKPHLHYTKLYTLRRR